MTALRIEEPDAQAESRPIVLLVEDDVLVRMLMAESLRDAGCEVVEAAHADEAVRALDSVAVPDVMITDVKLPGSMNGVELAARVRLLQPSMKVIVTSGHAAAEDALEVADAFLAKPFQLQQLVGHVHTLAMVAA